MNYSRAFTEVNEVLKKISKVEYDKIPQDILDSINNNKDNNYIWHYDVNKSLEEQNLSKEAKDLLSYISMEYLIDSIDKEKIRDYFKGKKIVGNSIDIKKVLSYDEMFSKNNIEYREKLKDNSKLPKQKEKSIFQKIKRIINRFLGR